MSAREDAVARVLVHHKTTDPRQVPLLEFLEACQPGFRRKVDAALAEKGLALDGKGVVVPRGEMP
jgi:hypothetical protein